MAVFSYETYLRVNAIQRLIELSQREKQLYKTEAYRRCGHGLTIAQFDEVVLALVNDSDPWIKISEGPLGAVLLTYVE
jgi:hypothetical protein